ncbi:Outer membrane lipoprotein SlyB [Paraburkholderia humisilvae]|uniref:Outer membrane lipoprotein SlyB n=2 Tax=Paraburkholderia humisilvae TaxID=627669 RepID=A0A6J5F7S6_9BURK|nr:glycine zipper 2TM domain-containing protein [Paraburkholderia humisilvae]CAB3773196.1 Outer membrane lipoprotein SlyB [Paraburkholderia humisilvae]
MKTMSHLTHRPLIGALSSIAIAAMVSALALAGCAYNSSSPDVYTASQAQREETVQMGTVDSVRQVIISSNNGDPSGLGLVGGGVIGGLAGSRIGGGTGSIITGIVGGLAGAAVGNALENEAAKKNGVEITVRLDNGELRAVTQADTGDLFNPGDRVRLLSEDGITRVTH